MANQYTTSALSGIQRKFGEILPQELRLLWEHRKKIKVSDRGCWIWQGAKSKDGYGNVGTGGEVKLVHRVVYEMCVGEIPEGKCVCHNCPGGDNPACCNPSHLFVGTHQENMQDAAKKGRIKPRDSKGEKNPFAKLTEEQVIKIRLKFAELNGTRDRAGVVALEFGVTRVTVYRVVKRKIWSHVS